MKRKGIRVVQWVAAAATLGSASMIGVVGPVDAQWVQASEQFYLPADHNWVFRRAYPNADRLFNAFDYGHAVLYEELYTRPGSDPGRLELDEYDFLTKKLLVNPPRLPLEEAAIEVAYAKLAPEAKMMFEWAHLLHRQIYDVLADERLSEMERDRGVAELVGYYRTRPEFAFSPVPKSMDLMDGQLYSLTFRERYPKFNGLIWAYHWLQVGLYEPLMVYEDAAGRAAGVEATVGRFWQMLEDAPSTMPYLMPMTSAVAPTFAARYPDAAIIFDNLHMMHDVISDILASPEIPKGAKRREILRAVEWFRDRTSFRSSFEEWMTMGQVMGAHNMGGPAVGFDPEPPEPTVPRGMSMAGLAHGGMPGMETADGNEMPAGHAMPAADSMTMDHPMGDPTASTRLLEIHTRMMDDPVIRERVAADPELRRMIAELADLIPMTGPDHAVPSIGGPDDLTAADRRQAIEFIVQLLSQPEVAERVQADPELARLWNDPEVQARLAELRRTVTDPPGATTSPAPSGTHQH